MHPGTQKKLFTVDELYRMEEAGLFQSERVELVKGEMFLIPPGSRHQARVDRVNSFRRNQTLASLSFPDIHINIDDVLG